MPKNLDQTSQNQVDVQPVALVQEDALVDVQHPHDVLQDHRPQDPQVSWGPKGLL